MDKIKDFIFKAVGKKGTSVDNISEWIIKAIL